MSLRTELRLSDSPGVRALTEATGYFRADEVDVAVELVDETLAKGEAAGYRFFFADEGEKLVGYACFGAIPCTLTSWDLYWIAVDPALQGRGLGRELLGAVEAEVASAGGLGVYVETSGKEEYAPTRAFYLRCGYTVAAEFADFYAPGDSKVVFVKRVG